MFGTSKKARNKGRKPTNTLPIYVLLVILFVAYFVLQSNQALSVIFGAAILFTIIALLVIELMNGVAEQGIVRNILEIVVAIGIVAVIWFGAQAALGTSNPLDVVPSCSMLPALQRGDMILLQGVNRNNIVAPVVSANQSAWNASFSSTGTEALECVAYNQTGSLLHVSQFLKPGYQIGLFRSTQNGGEIVPPSYQNQSLVKYTCGTVNVLFQNNTVEQEASVTAITIGNTTITGDRNNSIVVYQTEPQDLFYQEGDSYIVHRAYAIVNVSGSYYVLTKGDNNPGLDIQYYNYPAAIGQVSGKVVASIPYLGYLKLILSNSFTEPTGCNYTTEN